MTLKHHVDLGEIDQLILSHIQHSLLGQIDIPEIVIKTPDDRQLVSKLSFTNTSYNLAAFMTKPEDGSTNLLSQVRVSEFDNRFTAIYFSDVSSQYRMTVYKGCSNGNNIARLLNRLCDRHNYGDAGQIHGISISAEMTAAAAELAEYLLLLYVSHASPPVLLKLMRTAQNHAMQMGYDKKTKQIKVALGIES